jgi:hypothetical protein
MPQWRWPFDSRRHHILKCSERATVDSDVAIGFRAPLAYIARTVAIVDPEKERLRLRRHYGEMADSELQEIAADANSLSEVARETLQFELARRHSEIALPDRTATRPSESEQPYRPVALRKFRDLPDALLANSILDSANVECFLIDEIMIRMDWMWSNLLGGIKLWVRPEDADAGELLDQDYLESFEVEGVGEYRQPRCSNCQSFDISYRGLMKYLPYGMLWLHFPFPVAHVAWVCYSCAHVWEASNDEPP